MLSVGVIVAIDVVILLIWQIGFPIVAELQVPDIYRPYYNYYLVLLSLISLLPLYS